MQPVCWSLRSAWPNSNNQQVVAMDKIIKCHLSDYEDNGAAPCGVTSLGSVNIVENGHAQGELHTTRVPAEPSA